VSAVYRGRSPAEKQFQRAIGLVLSEDAQRWLYHS
jgi:hypothetical protein